MEGQPPAPATPARKNNLRHIIVVVVLSVLALGVSGAIIYFTLHVTGVIENITQNGTSSDDSSEDDAISTEYYNLVNRINSLRADSSAEDESLEADLKDYAGRTINEKGKDSQAAYDAIMALVSYYNLMDLYDDAKEYLEDRISVSDDDQKTYSYIAELYRLATEYGDDETANYYLAQINDETDPEIKSAKLQAVAYQLLIKLFDDKYNNIDTESDEDNWCSEEHQSTISQIREYATRAEQANPSGATAYLLGVIEASFGDSDKAVEYFNLAAERDPAHYKGEASDTEI